MTDQNKIPTNKEILHNHYLNRHGLQPSDYHSFGINEKNDLELLAEARAAGRAEGAEEQRDKIKYLSDREMELGGRLARTQRALDVLQARFNLMEKKLPAAIRAQGEAE